MSATGTLLYGDTLRSPALRHEVPVAIGDPLLFAELFDGTCLPDRCCPTLRRVGQHRQGGESYQGVYGWLYVVLVDIVLVEFVVLVVVVLLELVEPEPDEPAVTTLQVPPKLMMPSPEALLRDDPSPLNM